MIITYKLKDKDENNTQEMTKDWPVAKVVLYLPIIPRIKFLFANPNDAKNFRWHGNERKCDDMFCHLIDFMQWKKFDDKFHKFFKKLRNLRLGLAIDGMISVGNLSMNHTLWSFLLVIYNLPLRLRMKQKYIMVSMTTNKWHRCLSKSTNWRS